MDLPNLRGWCNGVLVLLSQGPPTLYFLSSSAFKRSIPAIMASVLEAFSLSAHSWILLASLSDTRIVILPFRDCSPLGGRPVLGDIIITSLLVVLIY